MGYSKLAVSGTVTQVSRRVARDRSVYMTVTLSGGRTVKYLQTWRKVPVKGQRVEIRGIPIVGDPKVDMGAVEVRAVA